jgi:hypothetical protein
VAAVLAAVVLAAVEVAVCKRFALFT